MIVVDRQDIATKLRDLIDNSIGPNAENLVETVLDYVPVSPEGLSPLISVAPISSEPGNSSAGRISELTNFIVYIFVLYSHTDREIDERDAWVRLNTLHKRIVELLLLNKKVEGLWQTLKFNPGGAIMPIKIDDQGYLLEPLPITVGVY